MLKILNLKDEPEHLSTLAEWHQQQWSSLNPGETIDMRIIRMQDYLNNDFIPTTFIATFIAKQDVLIGSAAIVENDMEILSELSPWLASVFIAPPYRKKGFGTKLVLHVMQQARLHGIEKLYLYTPDDEDFYKGLGWVTLSHETYHGQQVTVMSTDLIK